MKLTSNPSSLKEAIELLRTNGYVLAGNTGQGRTYDEMTTLNQIMECVAKKKFPSHIDVDMIVTHILAVEKTDALYQFIACIFKVWWKRGFGSILCCTLYRRALLAKRLDLMSCIRIFYEETPNFDLKGVIRMEELALLLDEDIIKKHIIAEAVVPLRVKEVTRDLTHLIAELDSLTWTTFVQVIQDIKDGKGIHYKECIHRDSIPILQHIFFYALFLFQRADLISSIAKTTFEYWNILSVEDGNGLSAWRYFSLIKDEFRRESLFYILIQNMPQFQEHWIKYPFGEAKRSMLISLAQNGNSVPLKHLKFIENASDGVEVALHFAFARGDKTGIKQILGHSTAVVSNLMAICALEKRFYHLMPLIAKNWHSYFFGDSKCWKKIKLLRAWSPEALEVINFWIKRTKLFGSIRTCFDILDIDWKDPPRNRALRFLSHEYLTSGKN